MICSNPNFVLLQIWSFLWEAIYTENYNLFFSERNQNTTAQCGKRGRGFKYHPYFNKQNKIQTQINLFIHFF